MLLHADSHRLRVEVHSLFIQEAAQRTVVGQLAWSPDRKRAVGHHEPERVGNLQSQLHVVGGKEDGLVRFAAEMVQELQHLHLAGIVEEGRWLVEVDDGRLLCEGFGYHHLLSLAVAQRLHHTVAQGFDTHQTDALFHNLAVVGIERSPETGVGRSSEGDEFEDRHILNVGLRGQDDTDELGQFAVGELRKALSVDGDIAT